jgi:hypothetical protein
MSAFGDQAEREGSDGRFLSRMLERAWPAWVWQNYHQKETGLKVACDRHESRLVEKYRSTKSDVQAWRKKRNSKSMYLRR